MNRNPSNADNARPTNAPSGAPRRLLRVLAMIGLVAIPFAAPGVGAVLPPDVAALPDGLGIVPRVDCYELGVDTPVRLPAPAAVPSCLICDKSVVSGAATRWTHYGPNGVNGAQQPSVALVSNGGWQNIPPRAPTSSTSSFPNPVPIWKQSPAQGNTILPVMFEPAPFHTCASVPLRGELRIVADNAFLAVLNGQEVARCGNLYHTSSPHSNCFGSVTTVSLVLQPNVANALVVYAWNHGSVAMVEFRLDY